ncbi:prepilin-type N-terminal cleavage/methylation domain-containing protein [Candidatus Omnitrophota bacterium]
MLHLKNTPGFTLTELLIAIIIIGTVILTVTSVDLAARGFMQDLRASSRVQDEVKIAMQHMLIRLRQGVGDVTNYGTIGAPPANPSAGFYIVDAGNLASSSGSGGLDSEVYYKLDGFHGNRDGRYDPADSDDALGQFFYLPAQFTIFDSLLPAPGNITQPVITNCTFHVGRALNECVITITARADPTQPVGAENPETTLTSSVVLPGMSIH